MSKLFATCWGMLFQLFRLGYLCLMWVCLGLVSGASVQNSLIWPLDPFPLKFLAS